MLRRIVSHFVFLSLIKFALSNTILIKLYFARVDAYPFHFSLDRHTIETDTVSVSGLKCCCKKGNPFKAIEGRCVKWISNELMKTQ